MSRAEKDRQQAMVEARQQIAKFARDLNSGKTAMLDRFGAKVEPGDYVLYRPMHDLIFEVVDVKPSLDLQHPVGTLTVVMQCSTDVQFMASMRAMTLIKCGMRAKDDAAAADITPPGTNAPHEPPTDLPAPGEPESQIDEPPAEPVGDAGGPAPPDVDEVV